MINVGEKYRVQCVTVHNASQCISSIPLSEEDNKQTSLFVTFYKWMQNLEMNIN